MVIVLYIIEILGSIKMIKIRLTYSNNDEKEIAIEKIRKSFSILNISKEYKGRGNSKFSNVYIDADVNSSTQ